MGLFNDYKDYKDYNDPLGCLTGVLQPGTVLSVLVVLVVVQVLGRSLLAMRCRLDKIVLNKSATAPTGAGPAESGQQ